MWIAPLPGSITVKEPDVQQDIGIELLEIPKKLRIRTLLIDSDRLAAVRLQEILKQDAEIDILGICEDGSEALALIRSLRPDLIFLDVRIPGIDGFSLLEQLRGEPMPAVIFVTENDRYALKAFEFSALDYLLKPFGPERVRKAVQKMKALIQPEEKHPGGSPAQQRLAIRSGKKVFFLNPDEIDWIEAEGNSVHVRSGRESHLLKLSISSLELQLDPARFIRIHRSTIVNLERVRWLEPAPHGNYRVILHDGTTLVMSRKQKLAAMTGKSIRSRLES